MWDQSLCHSRTFKTDDFMSWLLFTECLLEARLSAFTTPFPDLIVTTMRLSHDHLYFTDEENEAQTKGA